MKWHRRTEVLYIVAATLILVGLGFLIAKVRPAEDSLPDSLMGLWLTRPSDLLLQAALLLGGSLAIRALLSDDTEENS